MLNARTLLVRICTIAALCCLGSPAIAQGPLAATEQAYQEVDFPRMVRLAQEAIETGELEVDEISRAYELLGLALAANRDEAASVEAFKRMLALLPDSEVDQNQPPHLRAPFLDALGFWDMQSRNFELRARASRARRGIRLELSDPLRMAATVELYVQNEDDTDYELYDAQPERSQLIPVENMANDETVRYFAVALDEHGNRLITSGSEDQPHVLSSLSESAERSAGAMSGEPRPWYGSAWFWTTAGIVLAGAGVGTYFLVNNQTYNLESQLSFQPR